MDEDGKRRASDYAAERAARLGLSPAALAERAQVDVATVRDFLEGKRWPRSTTRGAIEDALDMRPGSLELTARGLREPADDGDEVERVIKASALSRANQHRLIGLYYEMLEDQERQGVRGA